MAGGSYEAVSFSLFSDLPVSLDSGIGPGAVSGTPTITRGFVKILAAT